MNEPAQIFDPLDATVHELPVIVWSNPPRVKTKEGETPEVKEATLSCYYNLLHWHRLLETQRVGGNHKYRMPDYFYESHGRDLVHAIEMAIPSCRALYSLYVTDRKVGYRIIVPSPDDKRSRWFYICHVVAEHHQGMITFKAVLPHMLLTTTFPMLPPIDGLHRGFTRGTE